MTAPAATAAPLAGAARPVATAPPEAGPRGTVTGSPEVAAALRAVVEHRNATPGDYTWGDCGTHGEDVLHRQDHGDDAPICCACRNAGRPEPLR